MPAAPKLLAFDTSTDRLSIAVSDGVRTWSHSGPGGAQASTSLIPAILSLLAEAGLSIDGLDAIVFGRGPGSFTGLRTACAVAQGLAFGARQGAGVPVLPVDTLMAVAEEARWLESASDANSLKLPWRVTALLDARMDEMYMQGFEFVGDVCRSLGNGELVCPESLQPDPASDCWAGNVFTVYADRLPSALAAARQREALPTATALLRLAPALMAAGQCVDAALALPLYVRDKVAQTTEEREQLKAAKLASVS